MILYSLFTIHASLPLLSCLYLSRLHGNAPFPFPNLLLKLLDFVLGVSKPVLYMIQPPTAPLWDEVVVEDEKGSNGLRERWVVERMRLGLGFRG